MKDIVEFETEHFRAVAKYADARIYLYRKVKKDGGDDRVHVELMGKYVGLVEVIERLEQEGKGAPTTVVKCKYCEARLHVPTILLGTPWPCLRCARVAIR